MADTEPVTQLRRPLPRVLEATRREVEETFENVTPNQLRMLKSATGMRSDELLGDVGDIEDKTQAFIYLRLRGDGYDLSWEEAGDVIVHIADEAPDPTPAEPSSGSPGSATTGA